MILTFMNRVLFLSKKLRQISMHIALTKRSLFYTLQKHIWADLLIGGISEEILFLLGL